MRVVVSVLLALCLRYDAASATCEDSNDAVSVDVQVHNQELSYNAKAIYYGDKITIFCTGSDSKNLQMSLKAKKLDDFDIDRIRLQNTEIVNMTTRKQIMKNLTIDDYELICTDVETMCEVAYYISVRPVVTVMAPSVRLINDSGVIRRYSVPAGEDYEIVCSGNPPLSIVFYNDDIHNFVDIQTISVNTTTIKSIKLNKKESDRKLFHFTCYQLVSSFLLKSRCEEFWCIEMGSQINCTWHVIGIEVTSTLLYKDKYGNSMLLDACETTRSDIYYGTWRCEWSLESVKQHGFDYHKDISLVLQACRLSHCVNQTYHIDSVVKSASPVGLEVLETEPNRAVITWNYNEGYPVEYNVTCRLPGLEWAQELRASSQENCDGRNCKIDIQLPCPGVLYELKMYVKSTTAPKETKYWSDPTTTVFRANSQDSTVGVDPMCNEEPEPIVNKYIGEYKAKEFKRSFMKDGSLHEKIQSTKRKLDLIKKLCREQSLGDCEHRNDYVLSATKIP